MKEFKPNWKRDTPIFLFIGICVAFVLSLATGIRFQDILRYYHRTMPYQAHAQANYVSSSQCTECHEEETRLWQGSHHDLAMDEANDLTVVGDFNDTRFTHFGVTSSFYRTPEGFFVNTEGPDGEMHEYKIKYTFGIEPLQQYLIEFPGGRLQCLGVAWDTVEKRWFHLYPNERIKHDDALHWTGVYQTWNMMCAECHSTDLRKNYDFDSDTYETTWFEIDVGCQACHGPGSEHVNWARWADKAGLESFAKNDKKGLPVHFKSGNSRYQVETCAPCHSRRYQTSPEDTTGEAFYDHFVPELLREPLYYPDGQILDEVYVYGSFIQSKMYMNGVRCTDCHDAHTTRIKASDNSLCNRCHNQQPPEDYKSLKAFNYDTVDHHFHKDKIGQEGSGSLCVECHMPTTNYMVVDPRRDHSFRNPRPDLTLKTGSPNACNKCHQDKTTEWSVAKIIEWYGPVRDPDPHFGELFHQGRQGKLSVQDDLEKLAVDANQPAIIRASAVELLRRFPRSTHGTLVAATQNPDPLVRTTAAGALESLPTEERLQVGLPLLTDEFRAVRVRAAASLAMISPTLFDKKQRNAFDAAFAEYEGSVKANADFPATHFNRGIIYDQTNQLNLAEKSYRTAIKKDHLFTPAYTSLANLFSRTNRNDKAEEILREGLSTTPDNGDLHYSLGLLLAEENRLAEAEKHLGHAAREFPHNVRFQYNHALALQHLGRRAEAEAVFLKAFESNRQDSDIVYALVIFYYQNRDWENAEKFAVHLSGIQPENPNIKQLLQKIRAASASGL